MMFRDEYRRMNDDTHASEALIRRTAEACGRKTERSRSFMPVLAVMVCMLALLVIPRVLRPQNQTAVIRQVRRSPPLSRPSGT